MQMAVQVSFQKPLFIFIHQVRWADLEERKETAYRRDVGFVVGQTQQDWQRMTDPHYAERQLNRTKYF
jgi:YLP motif-containing protein 1